MFGFSAVSEFPLSTVETTFVPIVVQRNAKVKTWTVPKRDTSWTIPVCKKDATLSSRSDTWTIPS
mgnify:FL=1|tara:strand:- start:632 stop:826 length:195 start_codon:yes stop_codon:yes gene_type:complete